MERWEHLMLSRAEAARLPELGRQGWRLAAVSDGPDGAFHLQRPALSFRERITLEQQARYLTARGVDPAATGEESR